MGKGSPLSRELGFENKDIFLLAMCLGFNEKNRKALDTREGYFLSKYLNEEDKAVINALAVGEERSLEVLFDKKKVFSIAEEYATRGIHLLHDKVFSGLGSFSKRFESLLVELKTSQEESKLKDKDTNDIGKLIENGENKKVEFKSSMCWDYKKKQKNRLMEFTIAKTVSAFMNSEGGHLLIGIGDDKQILGLDEDFGVIRKPNTDGFELHFTNVINKYLGKENRPYAKIWFKTLRRTIVAVVKVSKSPNPVYIKSEGKEEFYIRLGNSSHPLNVREATAYIKDHWK